MMLDKNFKDEVTDVKALNSKLQLAEVKKPDSDQKLASLQMELLLDDKSGQDKKKRRAKGAL